MKKNYDIIIIGAGASGMMAAISASSIGKSVLIIEKQDKPLQKVNISGGGNCNFTNREVTYENYISQNSKFTISALNQFSNLDTLEYVHKHNIEYIEKENGKLFCKNNSNDLINILINDCKKNGVEISYSTEIKKIIKNDLFKVDTDKENFSSKSLIVATGGLSHPNLGATDYGLQIAKQFGHNIINTSAGLSPFVYKNEYREDLGKLTGISFKNASVKFGKKVFKGGLLLTHLGLSGPIILQISSYWKSGKSVLINLLSDINVFELLKTEKENNPKKSVKNILETILPKKFTAYLIEKHNITNEIANIKNDTLKAIGNDINNWELFPKKTIGYNLSEATIGGVDTNQISSKTMESKLIEGLFFVGEVIDVIGNLGGFNIQWAFSSGYVAGINA